MAETLDILRRKLEAAEAAARAADLDAGNGVPGATIRAENLHREAQLTSARIARLEADPAELLKALCRERETICAAQRAGAAGDDEQAKALVERLTRIDTRINRLEAGNDTRH